VHRPAHPLHQVVPQLVDLGALAADDDAGTRSVDGDPQLVGTILANPPLTDKISNNESKK
jgi:hypothetical protein